MTETDFFSDKAAIYLHNYQLHGSVIFAFNNIGLFHLFAFEYVPV